MQLYEQRGRVDEIRKYIMQIDNSWAHRAGGGNFGIVTGFLFDRLPTAPFEVANAHFSFDWSSMTEDRFVALLLAFGDYMAQRGCERDTWGLFTGLGLSHISSGRIGLGLQFCNLDGRCDDSSPWTSSLTGLRADPVERWRHTSMLAPRTGGTPAAYWPDMKTMVAVASRRRLAIAGAGTADARLTNRLT